MLSVFTDCFSRLKLFEPQHYLSIKKNFCHQGVCYIFSKREIIYIFIRLRQKLFTFLDGISFIFHYINSLVKEMRQAMIINKYNHQIILLSSYFTHLKLFMKFFHLNETNNCFLFSVCNEKNK